MLQRDLCCLFHVATQECACHSKLGAIPIMQAQNYLRAVDFVQTMFSIGCE
jgi:hypothetical protein